MKLSLVLPFAAFASAIVIPDEKVMSEVAIESHRSSDSIFNKLPTTDQLISKAERTFSKAKTSAKNAIDEAYDCVSSDAHTAAEKIGATYFDTKSWLEARLDLEGGGEDHGHDGDHGHHGKHGKHDHEHKPNMTVYQLIAESKYTTKLAELINEYPDVVELLNGTTANFTVFAPIDKAFEKIPKDAPKPSKELLLKVLTYHVSPDYYPAGRVLITTTVPTLYKEEALGGAAQRLSTNIGLKGLTVNFYSRIIAVNIVRLPFHRRSEIDF